MTTVFIFLLSWSLLSWSSLVGRSLLLDAVEQSALPHFHIHMKGGDIMASIGVRLPEEEKKILAVIASQNNMTISQVMRKLIREYIDGVSQAKRFACQACAASGALASYQERRKKENDL